MTTKKRETGRDRLQQISARRDFLSVTAKLATVISALGLAGAGIVGPAVGQETGGMKAAAPAMTQTDEGMRMAAKARARELRTILDRGIQSGDRATMLREAEKMNLSHEESQALRALTPRDLRTLNDLKSRMQGLNSLANAADGGATGYVVF